MPAKTPRRRAKRLAGDREAARACLTRAAELLRFPRGEEHWRRIRTNNPHERILREMRRRTCVAGAFPDGQSAVNLAAARLRHIARDYSVN
jgi:transposase-like protein